jgi:hypothetical protein
MCLRTNEKMAYTAREAGIFTSIFVGLHLNDTSSKQLNPSIINEAAGSSTGMVSVGVAPKEVGFVYIYIVFIEIDINKGIFYIMKVYC